MKRTIISVAGAVALGAGAAFAIAAPASAAVAEGGSCGTNSGVYTHSLSGDVTSPTDRDGAPTAANVGVVHIVQSTALSCQKTGPTATGSNGTGQAVYLSNGKPQFTVFKWTWEKTSTITGQKCVDHGNTATSGGVTYKCSGSNTDGWRWATTAGAEPSASTSASQPSTQPSESASSASQPAPKPSKKPTVNQTCDINVDLTKVTVQGDLVLICGNVNEQGKGKWQKAGLGVDQDCDMTVVGAKTKIAGGALMACVNVNGKPTWKNTKPGSVNQTCAANVDLGKVDITGGTVIACANINGKPTWVPASGQDCPTGLGNCNTQATPVLGQPCPITGELVVVGGKPCACSKPTGVAVSSGQEGAATWNLASQDKALPVTGTNLPMIVGMGLVLLAVGGVGVVAVRRRRVQFQA